MQQTRPHLIKSKQQQATNEYYHHQLDSENVPINLLKNQIASIVRSIQKQLKSKNSKTRQCCFSLLTQLVNALPGALNNYLAQIIPGVHYSLKLVFISFNFFILIYSINYLTFFMIIISDKTSTSNMKIDTLNFLNNLLVTHDEKLFHPYLDSLVHVS